jgi:hypothetical protein
MSEYSDGDTCAVSANEWRTAKKPHRCDACHTNVRVGDRYHRTFYVFDGKADVDVRCERCQKIFEHLDARIREDNGGFSEEYCNTRLNCGHTYEDRWGEPPPEWLAKLAFWLPGEPLPQLDKGQE